VRLIVLLRERGGGADTIDEIRYFPVCLLVFFVPVSFPSRPIPNGKAVMKNFPLVVFLGGQGGGILHGREALAFNLIDNPISGWGGGRGGRAVLINVVNAGREAWLALLARGLDETEDGRAEKTITVYALI
jgi:hypothetical protein